MAAITAGVVVAGTAAYSANRQASAAKDAARSQVGSARDAILAQEQAAARAQGFFEPLQGVAQRGIEGSRFLANPQEQFNFLQSNPLFQFALDNANEQTNAIAASRGRLNAGDTLQSLSNNVLLSASPLIDRQREDVTNLLNLGSGVATSQANIETGKGANISSLLTSSGNAQAAGIVGAANARAAGLRDIVQAGTTLFQQERSAQ